MLFLGAVFLGFYLFIIRPAQKRQRDAAAVVARLAVGQEVMTTAGIFGTLRAVDDETVLIEVAPGTAVKYAKVAIARIVDDPNVAPASESDADADRAGGDRDSNA
ncbi:MAG: preprotein translocase subunit YajC [Actinobacteria bacterium]|nr:preprotein translocase subunit YajC [Actinomycetota bacterium]MCB9412431.1 preprotein translocase subunit YajC [Actinomycetota bacterium]